MTNRWPQPFAFVLQFPADADVRDGPFAGRLEHVVSGQTVRFSSLEELRDSVAEILAAVRSEDVLADRTSAFMPPNADIAPKSGGE